MLSKLRPTLMQNSSGMALLNKQRMLLSLALFIASMNVMAHIFAKPDAGDPGPAGIQLNLLAQGGDKHTLGVRAASTRRARQPILDDTESGGGGDETGNAGCLGLLCGAPRPDIFIGASRHHYARSHLRHLALASTNARPLAQILAPFLERRTDLNDLSDGNSRRSPDTSYPYVPPFGSNNGGGIVNPGQGIPGGDGTIGNVPSYLFPPGTPIPGYPTGGNTGGGPTGGDQNGDPTVPGPMPPNGIGLPGSSPAPVPLPNAVYPMGLLLALMFWYAYRCRARGNENTISSL